MSYIFISYSKKNKEYTDRLVAYLENAGFNVWYDGRIDYGDDWESTIFEAIDHCTAVIVVMTPDSKASPWVRREYQYADKRQKPFFPLLLEGEEFPFFVATQFVNVTDQSLPPQGFLTRLETVLKVKKNDAGKNIAQPDNLDTPASQPDPEFRLPDPFEWVHISAGRVEIKEQGIFDVPNFWISKYPIAVSQYKKFIDEKGYTTQKYWPDKGWEWRQKEKIFAPLFWGEKPYERFFQNYHPIIGVSWYEAVAFCSWLSEKIGKTILLPTEQHWQLAAQGEFYDRYTWGNTFEFNRCNSSLGVKSGGTTPVTQYPNGASSFGVFDMLGNVWEWTFSKYDNPLSLHVNEAGQRTIRGGSWKSDNEESLQIAYRIGSFSISRSYAMGFRIAYSE